MKPYLNSQPESKYVWKAKSSEKTWQIDQETDRVGQPDRMIWIYIILLLCKGPRRYLRLTFIPRYARNILQNFSKYTVLEIQLVFVN